MINVKDVIFEGLAYTVMGICVVFLMLVIIMYVIKAMQFFAKEEQPQKKAEPKKSEPVVEKTQDDTELVAVITAAIAASLGTSASDLVIRSYKKISGGAWNNAGRREILDNKF